MTKLVREIALQNAQKRKLSGKFVFLMPAYNEGMMIGQTLGKILDAGYKNIIVVNDGSNDTTQQVLESFTERIIVLHHYKNRGQGAALETGFEYIRRYTDSEYVVCFDADGQHDIRDIAEFEKYLSPSVEILLGSRFL